MGKQNKRKKNDNIIPLVLDASFYHSKAMEAADKTDFLRALRYFKRALDLEPDNAVHHCNVAGMLAELGQYEQSNDMLQHVIDAIDPQFYDCYFYMANNYAYMYEFEEAERQALRYLQYDPNGIYAEDVDVLLESLSYELGRPTQQPSEGTAMQVEKSEQNDRARALLEQGKFAEAAKVLKAIIKKHPDFLPAHNNLALTYYYSGKLVDAIAVVERVLEQEENNLHALCNLAIFLKEVGDLERLAPILQGLTKLYPMHSENVYKLATTLGILGEHDASYRLFLSLYKDHGVSTPSLIHQIAVAAYNNNDYGQAKHWWQKLEKTDSHNDISRFYLDLLLSDEKQRPTLSYRYPTEEQVQAPTPDPQYSLLMRDVLLLMQSKWREEYEDFLPEGERRLALLTQVPLAQLQKVRKLEVLAALVEYSVLSDYYTVSKQELASRYGITLVMLYRYLKQYPMFDHR